MIIIKNLDPNNLKRDEKSYKNISVYHVRCVIAKSVSYVKINSVNPKYLKLLRTDESKEIIKKIRRTVE